MTTAGARTADQLAGPGGHTLAELLAVDVADLSGPATQAAVDAAVRALVRTSLGVDAADGARLEPVDYLSGSPATGGLYRLRGRTTDGEPWSLFCKVLQHVRHWPALAFLPPEAAAHFVAQFPWRAELELWDDAVVATLPPGLRPAHLHRVVELGDDRVAVWTEDVAQAGTPWDVDTYARAARLLGRWNARSATPEVLAASALPAGYALRMYAERSVALRGLRPLEDDALWSHPWLADHADLRATLRGLGAGIPAMLDRLDTYAQCMPHGDASPQNLLVPADDPAAFVVIDISFRSPHALGLDLGQLLVGLTHAGELPAARLPEVTGAILPAYNRGLADEGLAGTEVVAAVRDGFATSALLRSGFDGFLYGLLDDPTDEHRHAFAERVALARFLADQYLTRSDVPA